MANVNADQGQGGGVALEDAASLAALLPRGTTVDEALERLPLYEKLRDDRAHKIQEFTRIAGVDLNDDNRKQFNSKPPSSIPMSPKQLCPLP